MRQPLIQTFGTLVFLCLYGTQSFAAPRRLGEELVELISSVQGRMALDETREVPMACERLLQRNLFVSGNIEMPEGVDLAGNVDLDGNLKILEMLIDDRDYREITRATDGLNVDKFAEDFVRALKRTIERYDQDDAQDDGFASLKQFAREEFAKLLGESVASGEMLQAEDFKKLDPLRREQLLDDLENPDSVFFETVRKQAALGRKGLDEAEYGKVHRKLVVNVQLGIESLVRRMNYFRENEALMLVNEEEAAALSKKIIADSARIAMAAKALAEISFTYKTSEFGAESNSTQWLVKEVSRLLETGSVKTLKLDQNFFRAQAVKDFNFFLDFFKEANFQLAEK